MNIHPFINYGIASIMVNNNLTSIDNISKEHLLDALDNSINHFRVKPVSENFEQKLVRFEYCDIEKGNPKSGIYLSSSILSTDKGAGKVYAALKNLIDEIIKAKSGNIEITKSIAPISGEYTNFGKLSIGRGKPKTPLQTAVFCAITTTTYQKPCMAFRTFRKDKPELENIAIIPDLPLEKLMDFIRLFENIRLTSTENLLFGTINPENKKPNRPYIFNGNFPHAPRSSSLGAIALLGAIGSWAKDANKIDWAKIVLDSLKERYIYLIGTKTFENFTFNNYIIELAKNNKLCSVIDSLYFVVLFNQGPRSFNSRLEYQKFDLFAARFLHLFNRFTFSDFLAFRAEYPNQLEILFKTYFINMEKINAAVVQSARELGKWLNYAAYRVADENIKRERDNRSQKLREQKAKVLIELESSIFSARTGDALIFQAITRAGRLSSLDAPSEAELFMIQTATGEISLDTAKHLIIAFSRVKNKFEPRSNSVSEDTSESIEVENDSDEDLSDAQE